MERGSFLVFSLGRETKYIEPTVRILEKIRAYGILGVFSDEPGNPIQEAILEEWKKTKKKIKEEFSENIVIEEYGVKLDPFDEDSNQTILQKETIIELGTKIIKCINNNTGSIYFQVSKGRRGLGPLYFNLVYFFNKFKTIHECRLNQLSYFFITTPVPASDLPEEEIRKKVSKPLPLDRKDLKIQIHPLFDFPLLKGKESKILQNREDARSHKELAQVLGLSEKKVSEIKKNLIMTFFFRTELEN